MRLTTTDFDKLWERDYGHIQNDLTKTEIREFLNKAKTVVFDEEAALTLAVSLGVLHVIEKSRELQEA